MLYNIQHKIKYLYLFYTSNEYPVYMSHDMRFPTMWYVPPANAQTSLCSSLSFSGTIAKLERTLSTVLQNNDRPPHIHQCNSKQEINSNKTLERTGAEATWLLDSAVIKTQKTFVSCRGFIAFVIYYHREALKSN